MREAALIILAAGGSFLGVALETRGYQLAQVHQLSRASRCFGPGDARDGDARGEPTHGGAEKFPKGFGFVS